MTTQRMLVLHQQNIIMLPHYLAKV